MSDALIYLITPVEGVCVGDRFNGWLVHKHADGQWVSIRKLDAVNPIDTLPAWLKTLPPQEATDDK